MGILGVLFIGAHPTAILSPFWNTFSYIQGSFPFKQNKKGQRENIRILVPLVSALLMWDSGNCRALPELQVDGANFHFKDGAKISAIVQALKIH